MARGWIAIALMVAAGLAVWSILLWRASSTQTVCVVLVQRIKAADEAIGKPGTPGYAYYHAHPEEIQASHAANKKTIDQLPC